MRRYVLIGSGPAGIAAAEAIRKHDPQSEIVLISAESQGYYSRPGLAYYLTGEIPEQSLYPYPRADFAQLNIRNLNTVVRKIEVPNHQIELVDGRKLRYDRLLIATGANAAQVQVPGIELTGVVKLDNIADAQNILKLMRKARSAVVVGGGITALEIVEALVSQKVNPHYFLRGDRYWSNVLDEPESRIVEQRLHEEGVKIHFHTELAEIIGKRGRVVGVATTTGERIKCQMVAIAIGIRPRIELAQAAGLPTERGILVNEYLQTSQSDIYAAGDVAQVFDPLTGKTVIDSLWGPAREQGYTAGQNMCGLAQIYRKDTPFNVTRLAGLTTTIIGTVGRGIDDDLIGIARGDSETWRQLPDAIAAQSGFDVNHLRILVGENKLLGALVMGDQTLSHPLYKLISQQANILSIREQLLTPQAPIAELLVDFWSQFSQRSAA
ncbi:MAG TPA: hypothetical protein DEH25_16225 [Chloroflexi bacterium]|nr:hypothetical protein [Chloroflexota bacterium]